MKLSFKYCFKLNEIKKEIINDLSWHTSKMYNIVMYDILQGNIECNLNSSINIISGRLYSYYRKNNWHSKYLHSHTMQQVILSVICDLKSYFALIKKYNEDAKSLKGKPKKPRYSKEKYIVFTKYAIRVENNKIKLSLSKDIQEKYQVKSLNFLISNKLKKLVNFEKIKMIKIKLEKNTNKCEMIIIYEKQEKEKSEDMKNVMAIDLGLSNIVACTNLDNNRTLIVPGKQLKSKNRYINNEIKKYQSINMKMLKDSKKHKNTKKIKKLYEYRKNYMNTNMHKISKMVIEYAKENKCYEIVIGDIRHIKQEMNYNKSFVQIPLQILVEKIKYKAKLEGIEVKLIKEKYTSGVSALDLETIDKNSYNKKRRIRRGIFVTNKGIKINADINGSLNILRKYIKNSSPNLEIAMDIGREQRPMKKRVA